MPLSIAMFWRIFVKMMLQNGQIEELSSMVSFWLIFSCRKNANLFLVQLAKIAAVLIEWAKDDWDQRVEDEWMLYIDSNCIYVLQNLFAHFVILHDQKFVDKLEKYAKYFKHMNPKFFEWD